MTAPLLAGPSTGAFPPRPMLPARLLTLAPPPSIALGQVLTPPLPALPSKDPSETLAYGLDFALLTGGAAIVQLDYAVSGDPELGVVSAIAAGTVATLVMGGGTAGMTPTIAVTVTLADGEQVTRAVTLPVVLQAALVAPSPAALTVNGFALTVGGESITF